MNITNDKEVVVYKNEYGKYSVMLRKKNQDDTFESAYIPIQFNKDVKLENKTPIKIKNAWLTFYKLDTQDGNKETRYIIRCTEFELAANKTEEEPKRNPFEEFGKTIETESQIGEQIQITDDDLPF